MSNKKSTRDFLLVKARTLAVRSNRLTVLTPECVGIRGAELRYSPPALHFKAANDRLAEIDNTVKHRLEFMKKNMSTASVPQVLVYAAMVEREIDRARRTFGLFFEVFGQRGTAFAPALAAHDAIAADCYSAVQQNAPQIFTSALLKPLTYLEHGYSPATMRRGVSLSRLLGERNPFPLIRIPWDRDNPWQAVFLHEVSHNLQADLRIWQENKNAVGKRMMRSNGDPTVVSTYTRWHKEIFADLAAVLLGGPASVWGMMDFLAHPHPKVLTFKPGGAHPTGFFRVPILAEMLHRMGFSQEAAKVKGVWTTLYKPRAGHRLPRPLVETADRVIPHVVDEIAFQPRRNLAQRALADIIRFGPNEDRAVRRAAVALTRGIVPKELPPRFIVSASRLAIEHGAAPPQLSKMVIKHLADLAATTRSEAGMTTLLAA